MGSLITNRKDLIHYPPNPVDQRRRESLLDFFDVALDSVDPLHLIQRSISIDPSSSELHVYEDRFSLRDRKVWVIGVGKAAGRMAKGLERILHEFEMDGIVLVPSGREINLHLPRVECIPTTHPLPSEINIKATQRLTKVLKAIPETDLVLSLVSGGGSAMLVDPKPPITVNDLIKFNSLLIKSGMSIREINVVRKEVSLVKGGKLANMTKADILVFTLSDVIGDDFGSIASGPFFPKSTSTADAMRVLKRYGLWGDSTRLPATVRMVLESPDNFDARKSCNTFSLRKNMVKHYLLGSNNLACQAVIEAGRKSGYNPIFLTDQLEGDARMLGRILARIYRGMAKSLSHPLLIVSGGESTVMVTGNGTGGRNQELAAAFLNDLKSKDLKFAFLSCGTDGIDGNSNFAGVILDNFSTSSCLKKGLRISDFQKQNNTTRLFQELGGCLIVTRPSGTNVMDIQLALLG